MDDATTFLLAFLAVFGGIAALLWHLERRAQRLEARLLALETAATATSKPGRDEPPRKA